jgi:hypothetical protein
MDINIKIVKTKKDLKTFIKVPYMIFKDNPYWVPPLIKDELQTFDKKKNPAYESADTRLFVAYKDKKPVGRIAGILSYIANDKYNVKNLRFGWFDTIDDYEVASLLFKAIENWGKELGMESLTGPHGFTDFDPEGMLIEGFGELPTIVTIYNHSYYPELTEKYGFEKDVDYVEFKTMVPHETGIPEKLLRLAQRIKERSGLKVFNFKSKKEILNRAKEIFELLDEAFEEIYGSVPISNDQIEYYMKNYFSFVNPDMLKIVENEKNEMVGFMITFPNLSKAFQKAKGKLFPIGWYHILKALKKHEVIDFYLAGIRKKYRGIGVDLLMVIEIVKTAMKKGFEYAESNPELEDNKKVHAQWKYYNPTQHKRRRIYKKNID